MIIFLFFFIFYCCWMTYYHQHYELKQFFFDFKFEKQDKQIDTIFLTNITDYFSKTTASVVAPNWVSASEMAVTNCGGPHT